MFKKILSCFLVAIMVICAVPFSASADTAGQTPVVLEGEGWIGISTAEDFLKIGVDSNFPKTGNYYLQNDIDFGGKECGYLVGEFAGVLDGRGFALYNFVLNQAENNNYGAMGVFFYLGTSTDTVTAVTNLKIGKPSAPITLSGTRTTNNANFGVLAGFCGAKRDAMTDISNVDIYCNIDVELNCASDARVGGFIGYCRNVSIIDSTFTGSITVNGNGSSKKSIGGIVGQLDAYDNNRRAIVKDCTVNATAIASNATGGSTNVGGIFGFSSVPTTYVTGCTVSTAITGAGNKGSVAGAIDCANDSNGYTTSMLFAVTECKLSAGEGIGVYGYQNTAGKAERIYIYNNEGATDTPSRDIGDFEGFDASQNVVWLIDSAEDFAKIGKADNGYTYSLTGLYRLDGDKGVIDMTTSSPRAESVINYAFGGLIDGNGNALTNLNFTFAGDGYGLIKDLGGVGSDNAMVMNLNIGTPENMVQFYYGAGSRAGILSGGNIDKKVKTNELANGSYPVVLDNVHIFGKMEKNKASGATFAAGFMGYSTDLSLYDCSMNGEITLKQMENYRVRLGGITAFTNGKTIMHDTQCFADFTANIPTENKNLNEDVMYGGMIGSPCKAAFLYNCANFGDISATCTGFEKNMKVGGMFGNAYMFNPSASTALYCSNFGDISAKSGSTKGNAGACAGQVDGNALNLAHFANFGTVSGQSVSSDSVAVGNKKILNNFSDSSAWITTDSKAAVRLSEPTGLRFTAKVSDVAIQRITSAFGEDAVSYGLLIAPKVFVNGANAHTHAALEAYSTAANGFNVAEGQKAYLDLEIDGYFKGQTGVIAGSLVNIDPALYKTDMSAIAYVKIGDNYIYAETSTTKNIYDIACAALGDLGAKDTVDGEYVYNNKLEVGEKYFAGGELKTVGATDELYSCYTKAQRDTLNNIVTDAN